MNSLDSFGQSALSVKLKPVCFTLQLEHGCHFSGMRSQLLAHFAMSIDPSCETDNVRMSLDIHRGTTQEMTHCALVIVFDHFTNLIQKLLGGSSCGAD